MEEFFNSFKFRILAGLFVLIFFFMLHAARDGTAVPFLSKAVGWVLTPAQGLTARLAGDAGGVIGDYLNAPEIARENDELRAKIDELNRRMVEYERFRAENEQLREFLEIKEKNPDFDFEPAMVVGRDSASRFYSFTIDKGSTDGVSAMDPVINASGLVGLVSEVGLTHSKVVTILDATVEVAVMDAATREIGATAGTVALAEEGKLKFSYLPRDSGASPGDIVVTTGVGGIFPREIVVGTIEQLLPESHGLSLYAVIAPPYDLRNVRDVIVIKSFVGKADALEP